MGFPGGGGAALDERTLAASVTIARDEWGVPHIHGPDDASVAFGAAFAQAEDAYWQIEDDYIHALGLAAHWYGERYIASDALIAALGVERQAREEYARSSPDDRRVWDAFALGLNYYLRVSGIQPRLIRRWEPWMLFARHHASAAAGALAGARLDTAGGTFNRIVIEADSAHDASRTWVAPPARSATRQTLIVQSIDAPFLGRNQLYELHLHSESGWHMRGFALLGTPVPRAGHNEQLAWSASRPRAVAGDTTAIAFSETIDTVQVNTAAGVVPRVVRLRTAPGIAYVATADGHARALRAGGDGLSQLLAMSRASSVTSFTASLRPRAFGRVVYADVQGNVLHTRGDSAIAVADGTLYDSGDAEAAGDSLTLETLAARAFDTRIPHVGDEVRALVNEWEEIGGANPDRALRLDDAIEMLRAWDGSVVPASTAATLYVLWQERVRHAAYTGSYARLRALEDLLARLRNEWRTVSVPWGEMHRLQRLPADAGYAFSDSLQSVPLRGLPAWTGAAMVVETAPATRGNRRYAVSGVVVQAVELGARPRTMSITAFGQSADPASPVFMDQAPLYARGELKPAWFRREDVTGKAVRTYRPAESVTVPVRR
jgi:acyl-homoserine lactone acylase PvdQ